MQKQSARIKCKNNLFKSKQPRTIKTIIYNDIFTSLSHKKNFKVRLNSSRNCSVCVRITLDEMESSFARFNHVCFLFLNRQPKSNAIYSVFVVRAVFQLLYCCCGGEMAPAIFALANFQRIQMLRHPRLAFRISHWLSVSFFDYWPIRMSSLLVPCTE